MSISASDCFFSSFFLQFDGRFFRQILRIRSTRQQNGLAVPVEVENDPRLAPLSAPVHKVHVDKLPDPVVGQVVGHVQGEGGGQGAEVVAGVEESGVAAHGDQGGRGEVSGDGGGRAAVDGVAKVEDEGGRVGHDAGGRGRACL